jgi:hypothetical protein
MMSPITELILTSKNHLRQCDRSGSGHDCGRGGKAAVSDAIGGPYLNTCKQ